MSVSLSRPPRDRRSVSLAALACSIALAGSVASACSSDGSGSAAPTTATSGATTGGASPAARQQTVPTFEIDAAGMTYTLPEATAPAGYVQIKLVNSDKQMPHMAQLFELHEGVTMKQFTAALLSPGGEGAVLPLASPAGGPDAVGPGHAGTVGLVLDAHRTYAVICSVPGTDGKPHFVHGMITSFTTGDDDGVTRPDLANVLTMSDFTYRSDSSVSWNQPLLLTNGSKDDPHELQVLAPAAGKSVADVLAALTAPPGSAPAGPPPYQAFGGGAALAPNGTEVLHLQLPPGQYLLVCFVQGKDGVPHFMKGMQKQITVG